MTPQQALNVLDQATSQLQANRTDHLTIQNALNVLTAFVGHAEIPTDADDPSVDPGTTREKDDDGNTRIKHGEGE